MKIIDEACLDKFRQAPQCEYCHKVNYGQLEPHHWRAKGMGGACRMDTSINLISLCRLCHQKCEDGNIPRHVILALIAVREQLSPVQIKDRLNWTIQQQEPPY